MSAAVVEVENLCKHDGRIVTIDAVGICVECATTCALRVGANGAGKTTAIAILPGLLVPSGGTIRTFDEDMWPIATASKSG